jgi:hypothetical protein
VVMRMSQRPVIHSEPAHQADVGLAPDVVAHPPTEDAPAASGGIRIERAIMHSLNHVIGRCIFVDEVVLLDETTSRYLAGYLTAAIERADWSASFSDPTGPVVVACWQLFDAGDFVSASRQLAQLLYDQMRRGGKSIAPGDFAVLSYCRDGLSDVERGIALLKLDMDEQHLHRTYQQRGGHMTVKIGVAKDLLPDSHALQKCALLRPDASAHELRVTMLDTQAGPASAGVAAYFYQGFLATRLAPSPRRHTRAFLSTTDGWLAQHARVLSPRQTLRFYQARRTALAAQRVSLTAFAADALPGHEVLRGDLLAALQRELFTSENEPPQADFAVDPKVTRVFLRQVRLLLDGGVVLTVPATRFDELVQVADDRTADGKWRFIIESLSAREVTK